MKILHVINSLEYGGAERLLYNFIEQSRHLYPNVEIEVCVLLREGAWGKVLREKGIVVHCLEVGKWDIRASKRLYDVINNRAYDIVHAHLFPMHYYLRFVMMFAKQPVYVFTEHSTMNRRRSYSFLRKLEVFFYRGYNLIIANSPETKQFLMSWLPEIENKIVIVDNGVPNPSTKKTAYQLSDLPSILVVARLHYGKGVDIAIESVRILLSKGFFVTMTVVGDGPERAILQKTAQGLPIEFVGSQGTPESYMKQHDVLVIPSRREGFGLTVIEGLMVGIPVIAARVDAIPRLIQDGEHGLLFEPEDTYDLAAKIEALLSDEQLRIRIAQSGKKMAGQKWTIDRFVHETIRLYENLLREK
jgi:glycosyltransferase involved in cell wall biosynthesis